MAKGVYERKPYMRTSSIFTPALDALLLENYEKLKDPNSLRSGGGVTKVARVLGVCPNTVYRAIKRAKKRHANLTSNQSSDKLVIPPCVKATSA